MPDNILLLIADGLGNVFQWLPLISTLEKHRDWHIDIATESLNYPIPECLFSGRVIRPVGTFDLSKYREAIVDGRAADCLQLRGAWNGFSSRIRLMNAPRSQQVNALRPFRRSEFDIRMDIARREGIADSDFVFGFEMNTPEPERIFDVSVVNGYNANTTPDLWHLKSYPAMATVVETLKKNGMSVCCLGDRKQVVVGAENMTGLPLERSLAILKASKAAVVTDTGLYHAANLLKVPNVVIFTFTSTVKNYDDRFHRYSRLAGRELGCRKNCQNDIEWKKCKGNECRNVDPMVVSNMVMEILGEKI